MTVTYQDLFASKLLYKTKIKERSKEMILKLIKSTAVDVGKDKENDEQYIDLDNMNWFKWIFHVLKMSPSDLLLFYNEKMELIDWDNKIKTVAQPLGHWLTISTFIIRFLQDNLIKPNYMNIYDTYKAETLFDFTKSDTLRKYNLLPQVSQINKNYNMNSSDKMISQFYIKMQQYNSNNSWYYNSLKHLDYCFYALLFFIVIINIFISIRFLFGYYKYYSLFYSLKVSTDSPDVTKRPLKTLIENNDEYLSKRTLLSVVKKNIVKLFNRNDINQKSTNSSSEKDYYYEVRKWTPTKFITNLFMTFSPIPLIFLIFSSVSFFTLFAVLIHQYLFQLILNKYQNRIMDDNTLFSAFLEEYHIKVVKPLVSKKYQNVQIDATPNGRGFVAFYPFAAPKENNIFKTHTLTGDLIREQYNKNTHEFEEIEENTKSHNDTRSKSLNLQNVYWDPDKRKFVIMNLSSSNVIKKESSR